MQLTSSNPTPCCNCLRMRCGNSRSDVLAFYKSVDIFGREQSRAEHSRCLNTEFVDLFWLIFFSVAVLREDRSGFRFPAGVRLFQLFRNVQTSSGPTKWVSGVIYWRKSLGAWNWPRRLRMSGAVRLLATDSDCCTCTCTCTCPLCVSKWRTEVTVFKGCWETCRVSLRKRQVNGSLGRPRHRCEPVWLWRVLVYRCGCGLSDQLFTEDCALEIRRWKWLWGGARGLWWAADSRQQRTADRTETAGCRWRKGFLYQAVTGAVGVGVTTSVCLSVCPFGVWECADWNVQQYDDVLWVWNLVRHIKGEQWLRVFELRVECCRVYWGLRGEVTGNWGKLRYEHLHVLCCLRNILVIEWRRIDLAREGRREREIPLWMPGWV